MIKGEKMKKTTQRMIREKFRAEIQIKKCDHYMSKLENLSSSSLTVTVYSPTPKPARHTTHSALYSFKKDNLVCFISGFPHGDQNMCYCTGTGGM